MDLPIKTGKSKVLQLDDLNRYIKYHIQGHKYIIDEIYQKPIIKTDNRISGNHSIYAKYIKLLILDMLAKYPDDYIDITFKKLIFDLALVNQNYLYGQRQIKATAFYFNIDPDNLYDFYHISNSNFKNTIKSSLKQLSNEYLIKWNIDTWLFVSYWDEDKKKQIEKHIQATDQEKKIILDIENRALQDLQLKDKRDVSVKNKWNEFNSKVEEYLCDETNIMFYYDMFHIIKSDYIETAIDKLWLDPDIKNNIQRDLNYKIQNNFNKNAKRRHIDYIDEYADLIQALINIDYKDIHSDIYSNYIEYLNDK